MISSMASNGATARLRLNLPLWLGGSFLLGAAPFLLAAQTDATLATALLAQRSGKNTAEAQSAFLAELGVKVTDARQRELWFRGLAVGPEEMNTLAAKLPRPVPNDALAGLAQLYGSAQLWQGTLVIGPRDFTALETLSAVRDRLCEKHPTCAFFDPRVLTRITVVSPPGLAAFLPATGALVLSRQLLESPNVLHQFVLIHELAHLRLSQLTWQTSYRAIARVRRPKFKSVDDELARLSKKSVFSLLPDGVAPAAAAREGFVVRRGYREAKARNEMSEEVADSVAALIVAPERFCWHAQPVAPQFRAWIVREVLGRTPLGNGCP